MGGASPLTFCHTMSKAHTVWNRHHQSCLDFLAAAISAQHDHSWSPGFEALSRIAVGVRSRATRLGDDSHHYVFSEQALPLFHLPNLQSLYFNGLSLTEEQLNDETDDGLDFSDILSPGSSPRLRELVIEDAELSGYKTPDFINAMVSASEGLRHVAFQSGDLSGFDIDRILPSIDTSIQSFLFHGDIAVEGYRSEMYDPELVHTAAFTVNISDVMLFAPQPNTDGGQGNGLDPKVDGVGIWGTSRSQFGEYLFDQFGDSWNAIVFTGSASHEEAEMIDEGLVRFIRSVNRGCLYKEGEDEDEEEADEEEESDGEDEDADNVEMAEESDQGDDENDSAPVRYGSAIYLQTIDGTKPRGKRWFSKAIRAGRRYGIQVHTRTTPALHTHSLPFPWPASDKELQTSPLYGSPLVENYVLVPDEGLVKDYCANCGACEECFTIMKPAAWDKAREDDAELGLVEGR